MEHITVLTYNILSSNLADLMINEEKDNKQIYNESFMDNNYRWNKISSFLQNQIIQNQNTNTKINTNLILCLQEVSEDWLPKLAKLFANLNYLYINVQHGRVFNGNMGVLIAYPNKLTISKSEFYCVGKHIMITDENSKISASKNNVAILLILESKEDISINSINSKFGIVTYHMPCEPSIPQVALSHSKVLYKKIIKFMNGHGQGQGQGQRLEHGQGQRLEHGQGQRLEHGQYLTNPNIINSKPLDHLNLSDGYLLVILI